jgi:predicted O-methyltransferase YrrM
MSKFKKLIEGSKNLIRKPHLINLVLEDQEVNKKKLLEKYDYPNGLPRIDLSSLTNKTNFTVDPYTFLEGGSLPTDYMLLCILADKIKDCTYFEIGTWRGESAANVSRYANEVFTLNLSDEEMRRKNLDEDYIKLHGFFSKDNSKINHLFGNSFEFDFGAWKSRCDLIFIDGDHHYQAVKKDTESCLSLMKNDESIIVWHDYGLSTETTRWEVLRGILDGLPKEKHRYLYAVNNTLCAIYYPFEIDGSQSKFPQHPKFNFQVNLNIKKI